MAVRSNVKMVYQICDVDVVDAENAMGLLGRIKGILDIQICICLHAVGGWLDAFIGI